MRQTAQLVTATTALALVLTACSGSGDEGSGDASTITVAYQKTDSFFQLHDLLVKSKAEFEEANPGMTIELEPIASQETDYFTKLALMNGSPDTAPDIIYEDTFQVRPDAAAGYLLPMDEYLAEWEDWDQFPEGIREAGKGDDGSIYGVSMGTDTRGVYYNKEIFEQAGLPTDWQPENWDDLLDAARTVKANVPDVIPMNVYSSKAQGEATSMQGFEMLLYGTDDTLYDAEQGKWIVGSQGFEDSLSFLKTLQDEDLAPNLEDALDTNLPNRVSGELLPQGRLAIAIDGSWVPGGWMAGDNAWPEWEEVMGMAAMPTQNGQAPGSTSMSGGWLLSIGANAPDPQAAFDFIALTLNEENSFKFATENSQIAARDDVASNPDYVAFNPSFEFFSSLVPNTNFRPATPDYAQISNNIQVAAESVITGQATPEQAAATYDEAVTRVVGDDMVTEAG
ncbi:extracellular solute-binding protein [Oerskovia flava]|uniref:extracellular solute-binding protein n=1 Tax=Oerskovia flava TaxID=2986422 RepID=UPI00223FB24C|nr:extracellular solute-binding protein [Oerskovia sp. JB1-3-2]